MAEQTLMRQLARAMMIVVLLTAIIDATDEAYQSQGTTTYASVEIGETAVSLPDSLVNPNPPGARQITNCLGRLEDANVRWRFNDDPTDTEGIPLEVGEVLILVSHEHATAIRFIRSGSTDAVLKITCWQQP